MFYPLRTPLVACLAVATALTTIAQDPADRHPVYDVVAPRIYTLPGTPTELKIAPAVDKRLIAGDAYPFTDKTEASPLQLKGWRGERCSAPLAISTGGHAAPLQVSCSLLNQNGHGISPTVNMIRYTEGGGKVVADIIDNANHCDHPAGIHRAVWYEVNIPQNAQPGIYKGLITVSTPGVEPATMEVELEVQDACLPTPENWKIHLDLWQYPYSVARWHDVEPWSEAHFAILRPIMKRLAQAGQKYITCTLLDEAWNAQTYDWYPSMVRWVRGKDGVMRYDYSVLDAWIHFMHDEIGIQGHISCYSMLPWHLKVRYFDETTGTDAYLSAEPGKPEFEAVWGPFLKDFYRHMQEKGWADKTCIAIDERPDHMVKEAMRLIKENAPSFRIASAVDKPSTLTRDVYNISPVITHAGTTLGSLLKERKNAGKITTFYVCLHPVVPNTFTTSAPAEAEWLGIFAAANHLDGFLRWAYNAWNRNPLESTDFGTWPTGDCFLVYPGNRSSIRFERLRDGIEEYEKINLLREQAKESPEAAAIVDSMNARLASLFTVQRSKGRQHTADVKEAHLIVEETLRALKALK
ncbi:MAG: DUF4091 domain-containing protein [Akkermansia sp.]|nr:DUF4091 domain-containing protein [Akkermansia sp.]